uniref:G-protein coupled receptors family 1 profile domain-containing protein n=1 Tax=Sphaeramia orbicularis TaxID=375764 RepID=A0A672ZY93_9TELE
METEDSELCFPELINSSCVKGVVNSLVTTLLIVLEFITALSTAFLNLLVIISVSHFRQLLSSSNFILLSLAVSEFFIYLMIYPFEVLYPYTCWFWGDLLCFLKSIFSVMIVSASVGTMVLISVDRYVAVCDPLHYSTRMSVKVVSVGLSLCWSSSFHFSLVFLDKNMEDLNFPRPCYGKCFYRVTFPLVLFELILTFFLPVVIVVLYMRVFVVVLSQVRAMHSHISAITFGPSATGNAKKSEVKAAKNLGVAVVVFLICFIPYYILILPWNLSKDSSFLVFLGRLLLLNSCFNPFLYVL